MIWPLRFQLLSLSWVQRPEITLQCTGSIHLPIGSLFQVIPEVVIPQAPVQLSVPQSYRMPSPVSDTQLEELRTQKTQQVHLTHFIYFSPFIRNELFMSVETQKRHSPSVEIFKPFFKF